MIQRIKRVRVTTPDSWYTHMVGQEFFVVESPWSDTRYRVIPTGYHDRPPVPQGISAEDCEVLEDFEGKIVEQTVVAIERSVDSSPLDRCPQCGGEADNGHDRCHPPSAYLCSKCTEEVPSYPEGMMQRLPQCILGCVGKAVYNRPAKSSADSL